MGDGKKFVHGKTAVSGKTAQWAIAFAFHNRYQADYPANFINIVSIPQKAGRDNLPTQKFVQKEYRRLLVQNYLIFYCVDEVQKLITITRVIYARRDSEKLLD